MTARPVPNSPDSPYRVPPEPRRWPSIALAAAVHIGLLAFLFIGVNWQNNEPVAVEAEVWDMKTQAAAPPPPPPQEVEAPEPTPAPVPKVVETPPPPPPRPVVEEPPQPKVPDIALEREKKKAEQKKLLAEQRAEEKREREEREAKEELAQAKAQKAKLLAEKKEKELAEKKAEALAEKKAEEKKAEEKKLEEKKLAEKQKGEKLAKAKAEAAENAKLDKLRDAEMKRMLAGVGGTGEAAKSTAPKSDPGYIAAISAKVKSATSYSGSTDVSGNPAAEFRIEQLPSGEIMNVKLVKSSGVSTFDDAVEKGIIKASPLPKKKDGTVARTVTIAFKMKDIN